MDFDSRPFPHRSLPTCSARSYVRGKAGRLISVNPTGKNRVISAGASWAPSSCEVIVVRNVSSRDLRRLLEPGHLHVGEALDRLGPNVLTDLAANAHVQAVAEGEILEAEGTIGQKVGYLLDGALAMVKRLPDGREHTVGLLLPTDLFGRLTGDAAPHRLVAVAKSRVLFFDREAFDMLLSDHPDLERLFLVSVLDELDAARDWILMLSGTRVIERVATFLAMLARRQDAYGSAEASPPIQVRLPVSRKHAANVLSVRPESLSRALHALSDLGVIRIMDPATFEIPDLDALLAASSEDPVRGD
ncbi:Crp/Fnr family transcriptional regulator [Jannaschia formosa]|uniref:Crp/Fnr family transcriptional regulator n=1 Tax=Jannaschia formosa TaxID=2259592 RepID=UPI00142FE20A|nr:Crp/Fnr family transcriptional regulator [Jannaschia formosa]